MSMNGEGRLGILYTARRETKVVAVDEYSKMLNLSL